MSKFKTVPLSKAKTAWGLLQDVKKRVLAAPDAIDMRVLLSRSDVTPCGTVGCLAGECCLLTVGRARILSTSPRLGVSLISFAARLLGDSLSSSMDAGRDVFGTDVEHLFDAGASDGINDLTPGTKRYARAVVARVNRFMRKHEMRLRRTKLAPVLGRRG